MEIYLLNGTRPQRHRNMATGIITAIVVLSFLSIGITYYTEEQIRVIEVAIFLLALIGLILG